jgi:hypothetical protein
LRYLVTKIRKNTLLLINITLNYLRLKGISLTIGLSAAKLRIKLFKAILVLKSMSLNCMKKNRLYLLPNKKDTVPNLNRLQGWEATKYRNSFKKL